MVLTDITLGEVRARIEKSVNEERRQHEKARKEARVLYSSSLKEVHAALTKIDPKQVVADLYSAFDQFLKDANAEIIDTTRQQAGTVFEKYFATAPPFGASADKRYEFPDAFVVEALVEWADRSGEELFVVSADELFRKACEGCVRLCSKKTLAEVLDRVVSDEQTAAYIRAELVKRAGEIAAKAKAQFEDRQYYVEDEDGDAEVQVKKMELSGEPEILELGEDQADVQMTFDTDFVAHLSYSDSDTGMWDSEEKQMIFMETKEESVDRNEDFVVQVRVRFEGIVSEAFAVEGVDLVEPNDSYLLSTSKNDGYPWK